MERILAKYLMSSVGSSTDPLQFAYRRNRGTDDAVNYDEFCNLSFTKFKFIR